MYTPVIVLLFLGAVFTGVQSEESLMTAIEDLMSTNWSDVIVEVNLTNAELEDLVFFNLWTTSNPETADIIYLDNATSLSASNWNASLPTRIIIHGWKNTINDTVVTGIREAYFAVGDYNVIAVEWKSISAEDYMYARARIYTVGQYVGQMIDYLQEEGMNLDDLIVLGHSLGAHVAGVACRTATDVVAILLGMDPAGPFFYANDQNAKMTKTDADYVQVVHSNAGGLGYNGVLGDADFWPNGGEWQSGCLLDIACCHGRSHLYVAESITTSTSSGFVGYACDSWSSYTSGDCSSNATSYFGGATVDTSASGSYALHTNSASPYAEGS